MNNFKLLNTTDQIYLIVILSTRYTFIYDIYGNVNFFILFTHQKFAYNLYSFRADIHNSPKDERQALKDTT